MYPCIIRDKWMLLVLSVRRGHGLLLLLDLWLKLMHRILLLMLLLLRLLLLLLILIVLRLVILRLVRLLLLLLVVLLRDLSILWLVMLLLGIHGSLVAIVLRVNRDRRAKDFDRAIVSSNCDHVLAVGAAILGIFEPTRQTGHTGQADTEETKDGANNTINLKPLAREDSFYFL